MWGQLDKFGNEKYLRLYNMLFYKNIHEIFGQDMADFLKMKLLNNYINKLLTDK